MDFTPYISPTVTVVIAIVGAYAAMKNANNAKFEELMVQNAQQFAEIRALKEQVEKHNGVIERTYRLETEMRTAFMRIDELKAADAGLISKVDEHLYGGR